MSDQDEWLLLPTAISENGRNQGFRPALVFSVLLHLGLLYALTQLARPSQAPAPTPSLPQPLTLTVVTSNPQRRVAEAPPEVSADAPSSTTPSPVPAPVAPAVTTPAVVTIPQAEEDISTTPDSSEEAVAEPGIAPLNSAGLQTMITAVVRSEKGSMLEQWIEACERYRNRYQTEDCPQGEEAKTARQAAIETNMAATFSTWVTGHDRNERISEELLDDMNTLRPLMEAGGLLGTLAAENYYFKREQYYYLNGSEGAEKYGGEYILPLLTFSISLRGLSVRMVTSPDLGPAKPFRETEAVHHALEEAP